MKQQDQFRGIPVSIRFFIAALLSLGLVLADTSLHLSKEIRGSVDTIFSPLYSMANSPAALSSAVRQQMRTRYQLVDDNRRLQETMMLLKGELLKYGQMKQENEKLKALLGSPIQSESRVEVAEIMSVATDPFEQRIVINKGRLAGVYEGQPLIGEDGIVGQITDVSPNMSRAILISDRKHSIPVRNVRNDIRGIAQGTGLVDMLVMDDLPRNVDIKVGDLLVTSGLGGKFPRGYPVARVVEFSPDNGTGFAEVKARPVESLNRMRYVLLMWPSEYFTPGGQNMGLESLDFLKKGVSLVR
ncbi:MAG: rod shape-determining protein MreC [Succinivibrionaceae bacterium]|nr:rod shape-determining protein MreC [Succinivibrionaceae bacterium]